MNAAFYLSNNLHLYFSGKTCTANVDRQNMPLSRILQGNWNQKRVNLTAACIILLWKAGKFERLTMKADEREQSPGLNVRQGPASNCGGGLVTMKCFLTDLGWAASAHSRRHCPEPPWASGQQQWPAPFRDNTLELLLQQARERSLDSGTYCHKAKD